MTTPFIRVWDVSPRLHSTLWELQTLRCVKVPLPRFRTIWRDNTSGLDEEPG